MFRRFGGGTMLNVRRRIISEGLGGSQILLCAIQSKGKQMFGLTERQTVRQTDRQTGRQSRRNKDRTTDVS